MVNILQQQPDQPNKYFMLKKLLKDYEIHFFLRKGTATFDELVHTSSSLEGFANWMERDLQAIHRAFRTPNKYIIDDNNKKLANYVHLYELVN